MVSGGLALVYLVLAVALIIVATGRLKVNAFLVLIGVAFLYGLAIGMPALDKASPKLYESLSFSMGASQLWTTRLEWDFDGDGIRDRVVYWGQNRPVFAGPIIPPGNFRDYIIILGPSKDPCYMLVAGTPPATLRPGDIVLPNSNMGFKLNLVALEDPGTGDGILSNMGFKLNYTLWQGGQNDPVEDNWWGQCNSWFSTSWMLVPEPQSATKKIVGTCVWSAAAEYDASIMKEFDKSTPNLFECGFSGSGLAALFLAGGGWSCDPGSSTLSGAGPAAFSLFDGEGWSLDATLGPSAGGGEYGEGGAYDSYMKISGGKGFGFIETANWGSGMEPLPWSWDYKENSWLGLLTGMDEKKGIFVRGEVNFDSQRGPDISDVISIIGYLFLGSKEPRCLEAADVNDDARVDISDGVALLSYLFLGGDAPKEPFPLAGPDPSPVSLGCALAP